MEDIMLTCVDCKNEFILTAGERNWYASKGFHEPTRCPSCRQKRKAEKLDGKENNYGKKTYR